MNRKRTWGRELDGPVRVLEGIWELVALVYLFFRVWCDQYHSIGSSGSGSMLVWPFLYGCLSAALLLWLEGFRFGQLKPGALFFSQLPALFLENTAVYCLLSLLAGMFLPISPILKLTGIQAVAVLLLCSCFSFFHRILFVPEKLVLVYGSPEAIRLKFKMEERSDRFQIVRLLSAETDPDRILRELSGHDGVILAEVAEPARSQLLQLCYRQAIPVYVTRQTNDIFLEGADRISLFDTPLLCIRTNPLSLSQRFWKRLFDLTASALALIFTAPMFALIALAIRLEDGGPVFYRQNRATQNGKVFEILKFRTMQPVQHDLQVTKVGAFLRDLHLDELPQLVNILKGDMSIVGPRPEHLENIRSYTRSVPDFPLRLKVKGGLTGYAQIYGKYNTSARDKLVMDLLYIQNYSFLEDLRLILLTLRVLFQKESTEGFEKIRELDDRVRQLMPELENPQ